MVAVSRAARSPAPATQPLLEVRGLTTIYPTARVRVEAVRDFSLRLDRGDILGLVGESGCGKSASLLSLMRLVPRPGRIIGGEILFNGADLLNLGAEAMRAVRGKDIGMVFQDPMSSLNPAYRVGDQIAESLKVHGLLPRFPTSLTRRSRQLQRAKVLALMREVGIPSPDERLLGYPHEFSGGMQQRVLIAIALACRPRLLLADEPTTALDVTIQAQILDLMRRINEELGTAIILVTHDLAVAAEFCRQIAVMYAGQIVECGPADAVLHEPAHPYTQGLLQSIPKLTGRERLVPIPGEVPDLARLDPGCSFAERCHRRRPECLSQRPALAPVRAADGRVVRCLRLASEVETAGGLAGEPH